MLTTLFVNKKNKYLLLIIDPPPHLDLAYVSLDY